MSKETGRSAERSERKELPIERGFPIERVNEIAAKEGRARQWYRPIYTMHKWWARRNGSVFRAICLYSLLNKSDSISVKEPGANGSLSDFGGGHSELENIIENVDLEDSDGLWEIYPKDVQVEGKRILDPFMGGGTSLVEASRFGAEVVGSDVNPVAWLITKKELEAGETSKEELEAAFEEVEKGISDDITEYYTTPCPNSNDGHIADVMYNFWVKELDCVSCGNTVELFKDYRVAKGRYENDDKYNVYCPSCESVVLVDDWRSESTCESCSYEFTPEDGNVGGGDYVCDDCGQRYSILQAIQEQDGFDMQQYAIEYYCPTCDERDEEKSQIKGYKSAEDYDLELFQKAKSEWSRRDDLNEYIPQEEIPLGIKTDSSRFEGNITGGHNVLRQGFTHWKDMFNDRQLLSLSLLLSEIDEIDDTNLKEYLLLAFSESLNFNCMMTPYQAARNHTNHIFKTNSFDPPQKVSEGNLWGTEYGIGTFQATFDKIIRAVEYAKAPTERYIENGETIESDPHSKPIGGDQTLYCGDARAIEFDDEFDAVITDPPYYDNVIYSELSDYYYVWQRILLKDEYDAFKPEKTPRNESIVANPAVQKGTQEFESELEQSFSRIKQVLKEDGSLVFTYHHSNSESWGELLSSMCEVGFEITATYPVSADVDKFFEGEAVSFDIVIVARPAGERSPISWNSLRRQIYRTAQETQRRLEENRELSRGDIGVVEMGECFHEYSKHHGKVMRAGEEMTAKEVVQEIYGIIQQGSEIGEIDVFLDLLETPDSSYDDLNKLTRGTDASPEQMEDMRLYRMEGGEFILGTWDDEKRMAYIQERVNGDDEALNALDKAQFLRYRYEQGKSTQNYLSKWDVDDELRELCEGLADATGDDTYRRILGADSTLGEF
ncbi:DUF1156 domain-containing protein [Halobellus ordinarius]|uniref:DUF1156 domain-containing protein n=1 Tax=Halobellus ordinarius TaxID=3075120 RepID=UPI0028803D2C|nr:DUF1156 domain-containing protein [Halobellus sp. ZY16]